MFKLTERTRTGRPRLRCTDDVLYHWADRIDAVAPERENFSYSSMICESDRLFHFGHHFELARIIRDKRGRARLTLLNGDSYDGPSGWAPSTASRQSDTRRVANYSNVPTLVVPFSALEAAQIDFDTIQPIHVRDDRQTIEEHSSPKRPTKVLALMRHPDGATRRAMGWVYDESTRKHEYREHDEEVWVENPNETRGFSSGHGWSDGAHRDADGVWHWTLRRHWLGDSIFRARCTESRTRKATADEVAEHDAHMAWQFATTRLRNKQRELQNNAWKLTNHADGDDDYRTMARKMFHAAGFRQAAERVGDELARLFETDHRYDNHVRDGRVPITVTRWATFLSSFDYQEAAPLYFLCELPYGAKPGTVAEAIELLKPPEVVAAQARGLTVVRQGDLFAIPTKLTKRQLRRMGSFTKRLRVLGTNHSVTEGIICKGGAVLGRGVMRHEPDAWRTPDHARQKLGDGKTWYLLVRNTVPQSR